MPTMPAFPGMMPMMPMMPAQASAFTPGQASPFMPFMNLGAGAQPEGLEESREEAEPAPAKSGGLDDPWGCFDHRTKDCAIPKSRETCVNAPEDSCFAAGCK